MIPVFIFEYSGLDPKLLNQMGAMGPVPAPPPGPHGHKSADMAKAFPTVPGAPSAQRISLLGSLPSLFVGLANFFTIPLANAIGRRPVMLLSAALSFLMLPWAAKSTSLESHLAARCFQALGTGAVESLVPLILQDMSFIHERNKYIALLWASGVSSTIPKSCWFSDDIVGRDCMRSWYRIHAPCGQPWLENVLLDHDHSRRSRVHYDFHFRSRDQVPAQPGIPRYVAPISACPLAYTQL